MNHCPITYAIFYFSTHVTLAMATAERCARKLRDVLFEYGILSEDALQGMSHHWECELVPEVDDDAAIREHVLHEEPCLCSPELAEGVHGRTGKDGLAFLSQWDGFPKPKICMRSGWGGPGTQATGDDHVALVRGFREVLDSDDALNLQLFHRPGDESDPGLPVLSESLTWPVPEVLETVERGGSSFVVDNATRVSKKGAVTWWHMDDCGEFTFQVGGYHPPALKCFHVTFSFFLFSSCFCADDDDDDDDDDCCRWVCESEKGKGKL